MFRQFVLLGALLIASQSALADYDETSFGEANFTFTALPRERVDGSSLDLPALQQKAAHGDPDSQAELAFLHLYGRGGAAKDPGAAFEWVQKAVDKGNTRAMVILAQMYIAGQGVPMDKARAFAVAKQAADLGNVQAEGLEGMQYLFGMGVPQDRPRGNTLLADAAAKGDTNSMVVLGTLAAIGTPADYEKARTLLRKAADAGDAAGQFYLARILVIVDHNYAAADELYKRAVDQEYIGAQRLVGLFYHFALAGFARDDQRAITLLRAAVDQDDAAAECDLGVFYYVGEWVPRNKQQGLSLLHRSASQGYKHAQEILAAYEKEG